jgi:hypothetical protein
LARQKQPENRIGGTNKRENLAPFWLRTFHEG